MSIDLQDGAMAQTLRNFMRDNADALDLPDSIGEEELANAVAELRMDMDAREMPQDAAPPSFSENDLIEGDPYDGPFACTPHIDNTYVADGISVSSGRIWAGAEAYRGAYKATASFGVYGDEVFRLSTHNYLPDAGRQDGAYVLGWQIDTHPDGGGFSGVYGPVLVAHKTTFLAANTYEPVHGSGSWVFIQGGTHTFVPLCSFDYMHSDVGVFSNVVQDWQGSDIVAQCYGWAVNTAGGIEIVDEVDPKNEWGADSDFNIVCSLMTDYRPIFEEVKEYVDYWIANH